MAGLDKMGIFGVKDAGDLVFYSLKTNKPALRIGYANDISLDLSSETQYALAKGVKSVSWEGSREAGLKLSVELMSFDLMGFILGSELKTQATDFYIQYPYVLKSNDEVVTLPDVTVVENSVCVQKVGADGNTIISNLDTASVSANKVTCTGGTKGDSIIISYMTNKTAQTFMVKSQRVLSEYYKLVMLVEGKLAENGAKAPLQVVFKKVAPKAQLSFAFSAKDPSKFEIELDVLELNGDMFEFDVITE